MVKDGDPIVLDNPGRCLALAFSKSALDPHRKERHPPERLIPRGVLKLCVKALALGHKGRPFPPVALFYCPPGAARARNQRDV